MFVSRNKIIGIENFCVDVCLSHIFYNEKNMKSVQYPKVF